MLHVIRTLAAATAAALAFVAPLAALADEVAGPDLAHVILVRGGEHASYLWNATDFVSALVANDNTGERGIHALEAAAVLVLAKKSEGSRASTVMIAAYYDRGAKNLYKAETVSGAERVVTIVADRKAVVEHGTQWASQVGAGHDVRGLKIQRTGTLPPGH